MSSQFFLMLGLLAAVSAAYWAFLTLSDVGRTLNSVPELVPFLTVAGILPLVPSVWYLGSVDCVQFSLMLIAIGLPFVLRGAWRIAASYVQQLRRDELVDMYERESK